MKNLFVISLNGDLLRWGSDFVCYTTGVSVERKNWNGIECDNGINGVSGSLRCRDCDLNSTLKVSPLAN